MTGGKPGLGSQKGVKSRKALETRGLRRRGVCMCVCRVCECVCV